MLKLNTTSKSVINFLEKAQLEMKEFGVKIKISPKKSQFNYYCFEDKILEIQKPFKPWKDWLKIFIHEYSHFLQEKYQTKAYKEFVNQKYSPSDIVDKWVLKNKKSKKLKESFRLLKNIELECELISMDVIKAYKLPINRKQFAQESNINILFYYSIEKCQTFSHYQSMNSMKHKMPKYIKTNYVDKIPKTKMKLLNECFSQETA